MIVYECGNFNEADDPPENCMYCGAVEREDQPERGSTVIIECPGWYD